MAHMHELLHDVAFGSKFDPESLEWNPELNFFHIPHAPVRPGRQRLAGFVQTSRAMRRLDRSETVYEPITRRADLPLEQREDVDSQLKGIGPRVHNVLRALEGVRRPLGRVSLVWFDTLTDPTDPAHFLDLRGKLGSRAVRVARHLFRSVSASPFLLGPEGAVDRVHRMYGAREAVLMTTPPHYELRQSMHHTMQSPVPDVPEQFFIIRNPDTLLHEIGTVPEPGQF